MSKQRPFTDILAGFPPLNVTVGLVVQVPTRRGDAVGQGQGHAGVVSPFPGFQAVRPAAAIAGDGDEAAWGLELDGGTQGIANGKADQGSSATVDHGGSRHLRSLLRFQAFVNRLFPESRIAQPYGGVHADVLQKERQHVETLLVVPKHLALDQFDLLRALCVVLLFDLRSAPLPTMTLNVEFHACAPFKSLQADVDSMRMGRKKPA
jgi:hypothetical protein